MAMVSSASSSACRLCLRAASNAERSMLPSAGAPPAFRSSSGSVVNTSVSSLTPVCSTGAPQNGQNLPPA